MSNSRRKRKTSTSLVIIATAVVSALLLRYAFASTNYTLSGTVHDHVTGAAVVGANVRVSQLEDFDNNGVLEVHDAVTDPTGAFSVTVTGNISKDHWDVTVVASGYAHGIVTDAFRPNLTIFPPGVAMTPAAVPLEPSSDDVTVAVTVVHPTTGAASVGASVYSSVPNSQFLGVTDLSGQLSVRLQKETPYALYAVRKGNKADATLAYFDDAPYAVTLHCGEAARSFTGKILDHAGVPLGWSSFNMEFLADGTSYAVAASTTSNGGYSALLPDGSYTVLLRGNGKVYVASVAIVPASVSPVDISFGETSTPGDTINGTVVNLDPDTGDEVGLSDMVVALARVVNGSNVHVARTESDADGDYSFAGQPSGDYVLSLGAPGESQRVQSAEVQLAGTNITQDLAAVGSGSEEEFDWEGDHNILGKVVDDSGAALDGASVTLHSPDMRQMVVSTTTDSSGNYTIDGVGDGDYVLCVTPFETSATTVAAQVGGATAVTVSGGNVSAEDITLYRGHVLQFQVQVPPASGTGDPTDLQGATVSVNPASDPGQNPPLREGTTGANGHIAFANLAYDDYVVTVSKAGYDTMTFPVSIESNEAVQLQHPFGWTYHSVYIEPEE